MRSKLFKAAAWVFGLLLLASMLLPAVQGVRDPNSPFPTSPTSGPPMVLKSVGWVVVGWVYYLVRVVPAVTVDRGGLVTAAVCLALFVPGMHLFCGWLGRHQQEGSGESTTGRPWRFDWSLSIAGLVLLVFVAGISMVGLVHQIVWLSAGKESKTEISFRGGLVGTFPEVGAGMLRWCEAQEPLEVLPAGIVVDDQGNPLHSWQAQILPFTEDHWGRRLDIKKAWDAEENGRLVRWPIKAYLNPEVRMTPADFKRIDPYAPSHIAGNGHVLGSHIGLRFNDVTDGLSQTILAGQVAANFEPWAKPGVFREPGLGINTSPHGFGAPGQGALMVMCDGSVRFFANGTDPRVLKALATPAGGEIVAGE